MKNFVFHFRASADNMGPMSPIIKRSERNEKTKFFHFRASADNAGRTPTAACYTSIASEASAGSMACHIETQQATV
jgi:hypothetical protein